ncbi:cellulase family glycosylhydrolase, partial [candidate division KSB1 bacterium]|nr:cellulase family glycosylhydrolase [candidate division KSB1 bacterium]
MRKFIGIVFLSFFAVAACGKKNSTEPQKPKMTGPSSLHTSGRWILDDQEQKVMLRGVNIASLEWTSLGENMLQSLEVAVTVWGCNLLRIPLCQDRWYGHTPEQNDGGKAYRRVVDALVSSAASQKVYLLLELHWNDAGEWGKYIGQHKMPDENSQTFLQDLGKFYADHPSVWIGLYNEPYDVSWDVWRDGGQLSYNWDRDGGDHELTFQAVGFQRLYDAVRQAGAEKNIIVVGGLDWGYDLSGILQGYALEGENIVYDTHPYPWKNNWDENFIQTAQQ